MIPKILYKYRGLSEGPERERTLQILTERKIYYPFFHELNDPFDGHVIFDKVISKEDLIKFCNGINVLYPDSPLDYRVFCKQDGSVDTEKIDLVYNDLPSSRKLFPHYGVLCLSENPTSILMWAHYSKFSGIAIEIDTSGSKLEEPGKLIEVEYSDTYPKIKLFDFHPDNDDVVQAIFRRKFSHWRYESEWRAIVAEGGRLHDLPARISGIILGPLVDPKVEKTILEISEQSKWPVKKLREEKSNYRLSIENLTETRSI